MGWFGLDAQELVSQISKTFSGVMGLAVKVAFLLGAWVFTH